MMTMDPYKVLEVAPGATQEEIKKSYRRLAKKISSGSKSRK